MRLIPALLILLAPLLSQAEILLKGTPDEIRAFLRDEERTITINATAERLLVPQTMIIGGFLQVEDRTVLGAYEELDTAQKLLRAELKKFDEVIELQLGSTMGGIGDVAETQRKQPVTDNIVIRQNFVIRAPLMEDMRRLIFALTETRGLVFEYSDVEYENIEQVLREIEVEALRELAEQRSVYQEALGANLRLADLQARNVYLPAPELVDTALRLRDDPTAADPLQRRQRTSPKGTDLVLDFREEKLVRILRATYEILPE